MSALDCQITTVMTRVLQALNNLAVTDENKVRIVEAGALPHYVTLLSPGREEAVQKEAAHGLWSLAFKCKDSIVKEPGCLAGRIISEFCCYFVIFS